MFNAAGSPCRTKKCPTPIIAYGHYPLSTIAYPETRPWWLLDTPAPPAAAAATGDSPEAARKAAAARKLASASMQGATLQSVLEKHGAQVYLCGHLHALFGPRLHRMHPWNSSSGMVSVGYHVI